MTILTSPIAGGPERRSRKSLMKFKTDASCLNQVMFSDLITLSNNYSNIHQKRKKMKRTHYYFLVLFMIGIMNFQSCCDHNCCCTNCNKTQVAEVIPHQIVVWFNPKTNADSIKIFLNNMAEKNIYVLERCACDENLILLGTPDTMDQEDAHESVGDDLPQEGKYGFNIKIQLDTFPLAAFPESTVDTVDVIPTPSDVKEIIVAIIDGGIKKDDPFLKGRYWINPDPGNSCFEDDTFGYDFVNNSGFRADTKVNAHGTIVSNRIVTNANGVYIKLMDLRVFDEHGKGNLYNALCALAYAHAHHASIVNMSWGYYKTEPDGVDHIFHNLISSYENIAFCASAGNNNSNTDSCPHYPSGFYASNFQLKNIISTAALDISNNRFAVYSNFGKSSVTLAAQGSYTSIENYENPEGTSFAAAVVTGKIGRIMATSDLDADQIVECIKEHTSILKSSPCKKIDKGKLNESVNCQ